MNQNEIKQFLLWLDDVERFLTTLQRRSQKHAQALLIAIAKEHITALRNDPTRQDVERQLRDALASLDFPKNATLEKKRGRDAVTGLYIGPQMRFSGPRDRCPKCGLPLEHCTCHNR